MHSRPIHDPGDAAASRSADSIAKQSARQLWRSMLRNAATIVLLLVCATVAAATQRRELLATGDVVEPLGRVGDFSATVHGIDAGGRLLVAADLSDGRSALYWLDEQGLDPLPIEASDVTLFPATAVSSPNGRVAVRGLRPGESSNPPPTIFAIDAGGPRHLLSVGDVVDGLHVVVLNWLVAIGDDGTVVALAGLSEKPAPVLPGEWSNAVVTIDAAGAHVLARGSDHYQVNPFGIAAGGEVFFQAWADDERSAIYAGRPGKVRRVVGPGDRLPSGGRVREAGPLAVSADGELLVSACVQTAADYASRGDCAVYRTERGRLVRVMGDTDRTPDGAYFNAGEGFLNTHGDVVLRGAWSVRCPDDPSGFCEVDAGLLYLPAGGGTMQIGRDRLDGGWLNDAGAVATATGATLGRWQNGAATTLLQRDDLAPGGAAFSALGLADGWGSHAVCIAADGRVGAVASFLDGGRAALCIDADGPHAVLTEHDPRLAPYGFWPQVQCAFADGDEMYIGAADSVVRISTATGVERIVGSDDLPLGSDYEVGRFGEPDTDQVFSVNRHGTVVAADGRQILRRRHDGPLEAIEPEVFGLDEVFEVEIADDESILATLRRWDDPGGAVGPAARVVRIDGAGTHLLARRGPRRRWSAAVLDDGPQRLVIAGHMAGFEADRRDFGPWPRIYDLEAGPLRELLDGPYLPAAAYLIDLAADGSALLDTEYYGYGRFLFADGELTRLSEDDDFADRRSEPIALGAPGVVLFRERLRGRQSLSMSGGAPISGRCPRVAVAAVTPTSTPTVTPRPSNGDSSGCAIAAPHASAWALFVVAALLGAFGRRAHARAR
ncbi:MAG: hypothetical protein SF182_03780 [Deltaproteobacteria bacterium]|nr:hypothetical protein [Deltaproteobacteria bacterium]